MVPGFSQVRALRAWAGVRPLYEEGAGAEGREAKRTFAVLDHAAARCRRAGHGGRRQIHDLSADGRTGRRCRVCAQLGVTAPCVTRSFVLPDARIPLNPPKPHRLGHRLEDLEEGRAKDQLICECEIVTRKELEDAVAAHADVAAPWILDDLRRDLRLGMGPCQGGFCGVRAAAILHESAGLRRRSGDGGPRRLRAAALEGPAAAAVGTGLAAGAAGRADLPRHFGLGSVAAGCRNGRTLRDTESMAQI